MQNMQILKRFQLTDTKYKNLDHHHSSFAMFLGLATWTMPLLAMQTSQRNKILNAKLNKNVKVINWEFRLVRGHPKVMKMQFFSI